MPSPLKPDHKKESEETKQRLFAEQKKREYNDFLVKEQVVFFRFVCVFKTRLIFVNF